MTNTMLYVAIDGSYGDAQGLRLLPAALVDNEMTEGEIVDLAKRVGTLVAPAVTVIYSCSSCGQESPAGTEETCCIDPHRFISRVI